MNLAMDIYMGSEDNFFFGELGQDHKQIENEGPLTTILVKRVVSSLIYK